MAKKKVIETKSGIKVHILDSSEDIKDFKKNPYAIPVDVDIDAAGRVKLKTTMEFIPTELVQIIIDQCSEQAANRVYYSMRKYKRLEILGWKCCAVFELISIIGMAIINFWR